MKTTVKGIMVGLLMVGLVLAMAAQMAQACPDPPPTTDPRAHTGEVYVAPKGTPWVSDGVKWNKAVWQDPDGGVPRGTPAGTYVLMGDRSHIGQYNGTKVVEIAFDSSGYAVNGTGSGHFWNGKKWQRVGAAPKGPKLDLAVLMNGPSKPAVKIDRGLLLSASQQQSGRQIVKPNAPLLFQTAWAGSRWTRVSPTIAPRPVAAAAMQVRATGRR